MKVKKLPLPAPWNADVAIFHLYKTWNCRDRAQEHKIELQNPNMVNRLVTLGQRDHRQEHTVEDGEAASGMLPYDLGQWRLLRKQDGSGVIIIGDASYTAEAPCER